jgi:hypothetical protein
VDRGREPRRWLAPDRDDAPDWSELQAIRDVIRAMETPLLRVNLPVITERCSDCHVPLHEGREWHYAWQRTSTNATPRLRRYTTRHRCTATGPLRLPQPFGDQPWPLG